MKARGLSVVGVDHEPVDTRTLDLFDDGQEGKS
jgi:hypothetical protein